jgi:hypothetical protein
MNTCCVDYRRADWNRARGGPRFCVGREPYRCLRSPQGSRTGPGHGVARAGARAEFLSLSDPILPIREPPLRTIKSDMFGTMAQFFKSSGEFISGLCQTAFTAWTSCSIAVSHSLAFHHWQWRRRF